MRRHVVGSVIAVLLAFSLVGCGDGEGPDGEGPTVSPTRSPTRELPSPAPSESEGTSESTEPEPEPSSAPPTEEPEPTDEPSPSDRESERESDRASDRPSDRPTDPSSEAATESPEPEAEVEDGEDSTDDAPPTWVWWLLAAILVGAAVGIPLLVRSRRRAAWRQRLAEAEGELGWLARELLPGLRRVASVEQVAGGWTVGAPRVTAVEDELTALESTAYDDAGRDRARSLRDACRLARVRMEQLVAPGPHDTWALDVDTIMADLEAALGPPPTPRQ